MLGNLDETAYITDKQRNYYPVIAFWTLKNKNYTILKYQLLVALVTHSKFRTFSSNFLSLHAPTLYVGNAAPHPHPPPPPPPPLPTKKKKKKKRNTSIYEPITNAKQRTTFISGTLTTIWAPLSCNNVIC